MITQKYRKKPVVIEAIKTDGTWTTYKEVCKFVGHELQVNQNGLGIADELIIPTLGGEVIASKGDYIIKGIKGEIYPCKPDIFEASYDKVERSKRDQAVKLASSQMHQEKSQL